MTLEEAIKHCEEVAENQEWLSKSYDDDSMGTKLCKECASEHRQLAEWLKELKLYREILIDRPCEVCEFHKTGSCSRWTCVLEGVNADDNIQS